MKNYILLLIILFCAGCAFYRTTQIKVSGDNIESAYVTGNAEFYYNAETRINFFGKKIK